MEQEQLKTLCSLADLGGEDPEAAAVIRFRREDRETWSRRKLNDFACRLAEGLCRDGLEPGDRAVLFAPASPEHIAALLAVLRTGAVAVPVDVQMGDEHLEAILRDSGAARAFTTRKLARRLARLDAAKSLQLFILDPQERDDHASDEQNNPGDDWRELLADEPGDAASVEKDAEAILFYTSGTTGPPKGVPLSHANIAFEIRAVTKAGLIDPGARLLLPLPLHHVYPVVIGVLAPLALGVTIVLPHTLTGGAVARALREGEAAVFLGVPRLFRAVFDGIRGRIASRGRIAAAVFDAALAAGRLFDRMRCPLGRHLFRPLHRRTGPRLRLLASGGSPLAPKLARNLEALGWPVAVGYGLTETSPLVTLKRPRQGPLDSVGTVLAGVEVRLDDSALPDAGDGGEPANDNRGELLVRGPNVFSGYHNRDEETESAFDGEWFRTGDIAAIDGKGYVTLHGRVSTMIVLEGGENIDPEQLEDAYADCDGVAEVGILEDDGAVAALVVPETAWLRELDEKERSERIRKGLDKIGESLASYRRLSRVEFSERPLERTRLGKLKRKALEEAYRQAVSGEQEERPAGPVDEADMNSEAQALMADPRVRKLWDLLVQRFPDSPLSPESRLQSELRIDSLRWVELSFAIEGEVGVAVDEAWWERVDTVQDLMERVAETEGADAGRSKRPLEEPESAIDDDERRLADPRNPVRAAIGRLLYALVALTLRAWFRLEARGLKNVPEDGCFVLTPNHASYLDAPLVGVALGFRRARRCFWAGWTGVLFSNPFMSAISRIAQVVPIDQARGPVSSLAFGALVLKRGRPLVWFPEGRRSRNGELQAFRPGIGLLLETHPRPVIPVYVEGSHAVVPEGARFPRPKKLTVHFGEPIEPDALRKAADEKDDDEVHARLTAVIRERLAALRERALDESQRQS